VKLFESVCKGGSNVGSRLGVQPICLDQSGTSRRISEGASEVASGLSVVAGTLPTGSLSSFNRQPSEPDVVHDHIRLREQEIVAIAYIASASAPGT
jgi:hypothetical protein